MTKKKKILLICGIVLDVAITLFLFIISIIMIVKASTLAADQLKNETGLIGYLINNLPVYLGAFVVPMFVLLALNIIALVLYVKKTGNKKEKLSVDSLTEEQKEALRKELLEDLANKK